jgi:hypothetical protein
LEYAGIILLQSDRASVRIARSSIHGSTPPDNVCPKPTSYGEKAKPPVFVWLGGFAVTDNFSQISVGLAAVRPPALH